MRTMLIIVQPPRFDNRSGFIKRPELVDVQALISQPSIKGFNEGVFDWFAWANEIQFDAVPIRPVFQCARLEFRAVINGDGAGSGAIPQCPIKRLTDRLPGHSKPYLKHWSLPTPVIDDGEYPKRPTIGQRIMHKVHTPAFVRLHRRGCRPSMQRHVFASADAHPEL
jgi:hypothetical protein